MDPAAPEPASETQMARIPAVLIIIIALTLGACGVKGPLEAPANAPPPQNDPFVLDPLI